MFNHDLTSLRQINPQAPENIEQIVNQAMALRPEDRFASFTEMKEALKEALGRCKA